MFLTYICMVIPHWTAKFRSANTVALAIFGQTTKFNSRQYFQLYLYPSLHKKGLWNIPNSGKLKVHKFLHLEPPARFFYAKIWACHTHLWLVLVFRKSFLCKTVTSSWSTNVSRKSNHKNVQCDCTQLHNDHARVCACLISSSLATKKATSQEA